MSKADRIPKKIVGLKLPRSIRRAPEIRSLLATASGRKILGDALMEGASVAAARLIEARKELESSSAKPKRSRRQARTGAAPAGDLNADAPQSVLILEDAPADVPAKSRAAD